MSIGVVRVSSELAWWNLGVCRTEAQLGLELWTAAPAGQAQGRRILCPARSVFPKGWGWGVFHVVGC